jgi:hypothetical protein
LEQQEEEIRGNDSLNALLIGYITQSMEHGGGSELFLFPEVSYKNLG